LAIKKAGAETSPNYNVQNYKQKLGVSKPSVFFLTFLKKPKAVMVCTDTFKMQTMTALIKSFCRGVQKKEDRKMRKMRKMGR
jgi:hypothetical protein